MGWVLAWNTVGLVWKCREGLLSCLLGPLGVEIGGVSRAKKVHFARFIVARSPGFEPLTNWADPLRARMIERPLGAYRVLAAVHSGVISAQPDTASEMDRQTKVAGGDEGVDGGHGCRNKAVMRTISQQACAPVSSGSEYSTIVTKDYVTLDLY